MLKTTIITTIASISFAAVAHADSTSQFHAILDDHWAEASKERVFFRTDPDTFRMNGKLPEFSEEARSRRQQFNQSIISRLEEINGNDLTGQDKVSFKLFAYERETERESYEQRDHLFPITSLFGYHTYFANAPYNMAFSNVEDYERYLVSLADFPRYNEENIALLREGIETGFTHYCQSMEGYDETISDLIVDSPEDSSLFAPFKEFPASVSSKDQSKFKKQGKALVNSAILPGDRKLHTFFVEEYLPNCRAEVGITSLEGGEEYYDYLIRYFTTTNMSPQEIHALGLSEQKRIRAEMEAIIKQVEFDGSFREFLSFLRNDPQFFAEDGQDLLEKTAFIAKKMDGQMPRFFGTLARNTYEIRGTQGRGAYYVAGSDDGRTPGTYFISTGDLKAQPLYNLEALSLHEAVPGHHHQATIARELDVPEFRKTLYHSAYGEGWGLYSESLGKEAGFYEDPYSDFGRLTYEMWRANRLIVDTGMHALGWSRQQAIDFLIENTALSRAEVVSEIDRYITWPAQALSYKIGELRIKALRAKAENELGTKFDLRAFHDMIVGNGSLAIAVLEDVANEWIDEQKSN